MTGAMEGNPPGELPSLGGSLAVSMLALGLVCLVAWVALRWLSRRGVGGGMGPIRVVARCPLEPRRSVYLIEAGGRCFLVGAGEGPMSLLAEVDPKAVPLPPRPQPLLAGASLRFGDILARLRSGQPLKQPGPPAAEATATATATAIDGDRS
jgi:flagellar biosynthetic protein FliO